MWGEPRRDFAPNRSSFFPRPAIIDSRSNPWYPIELEEYHVRAINLSDIHRRSGLSLAHISKIHSGSRRPSLDAASRIAKARSMTLDELFRDLELRKKVAMKTKKRR